MTHSGIECFLAICRYKTGSAAAQALYITQPSLSARLKVLEREVGAPLFYRGKGTREMALTPAGREFYPLAVEYEALLDKMQKLGERQKAILRVSCFNSLGTYLLPEVYKLFLQTNPQISLQTQDMEIQAASQSILAGETDLAFTAGQISDNRLRQLPVFSEPMVLVCAADANLPSYVALSALPPDKEVSVQWNHSFTLWHERVLGHAYPKLCVSMMVQLRQFLEREDRWAIVPISVANGMTEEIPLRRLNTDTALPCRQIACVLQAQAQLPALEAFLDCLQQVLATYPEIEPLI